MRVMYRYEIELYQTTKRSSIQCPGGVLAVKPHLLLMFHILGAPLPFAEIREKNPKATFRYTSLQSLLFLVSINLKHTYIRNYRAMLFRPKFHLHFNVRNRPTRSELFAKGTIKNLSDAIVTCLSPQI